MSRSKGILVTLLTCQEKGVTREKIHTIDLSTKIPYHSSSGSVVSMKTITAY
jgi:hypothetical protein